MELRTQAIDRVLEALAPALGAELDRVSQEARQVLESEFQHKLQSAVTEAEELSRQMGEVQLQQAVAETGERVRQQVTEDLQAQFSRTLQETADQLRTEFTNDLQKAAADWAAERTRLENRIEEWRLFADAQRQIEAGSQPEMLIRFLKLAERFAASTAVYVAKTDGLALWKSRGEAAFPPIVSRETINPELFFEPVIVRDRLVAAVCAAHPYSADGLSFLVACLQRAIELFGLKLSSALPQPSASEAGPIETAGENGKMHAEARRLARVLVSEIKLHHERAVQDGRANANLYQCLQREIESCREQYQERVSTVVRGGHDYLHDELVRVLAENDGSRMGSNYPGPVTS